MKKKLLSFLGGLAYCVGILSLLFIPEFVGWLL